MATAGISTKKRREETELNQCVSAVIHDVDNIMEKTDRMTLFFSGTQNVYKGYEDNIPYYSYANVKSYYLMEAGRSPVYGLVFRCKQKVESDSHNRSAESLDADVEAFLTLPVRFVLKR